MKYPITCLLSILLFAFFVTGCNRRQSNGESPGKESISNQRASLDNSIVIESPDFADPEIKKYYCSFTAYLKKVVTTIRNKDERATMKLFSEEGKQFDDRNTMEEKARAIPAEEQKFTTWLMQSYPYQKEIFESDFYKKFTGDEYKTSPEKK